jgi:hypothetical protein
MTEELPDLRPQLNSIADCIERTSLRLEHNHARVARLGVALDRGSRPAGMGANLPRPSQSGPFPPPVELPIAGISCGRPRG